jgi:predicted ATPase/DNA-binding winged helix-turn-helix (wHTH) protein
MNFNLASSRRFPSDNGVTAVTGEAGVASPNTIAFGTFRLLPEQQLLLDRDVPVRIGSRAMAILVALVERAGEIVSKDELVARAWPDTHVDEGNLRVHVASLRRLLGDGREGSRFVKTVPLRGYSFVAPTVRKAAGIMVSPAVCRAHQHCLPSHIGGIVGRDTLVQSLSDQLARHRLVTLVGAPGTGKTAVALAVAELIDKRLSDTVCIVDFSGVDDPSQAIVTATAELGLPLTLHNPLDAILEYLRNRQMLLLLDSCEHALEGVAPLAEAICHGTTEVTVLATSREPLRAEGERVFRVLPLEAPTADARLSADEALEYSAVRLLVDRVTAHDATFSLAAAEADPLAIDLAANRVGMLGLAGVASALGNPFKLLNSGRRTAPLRHQTLAAALEWSYDFLSDAEKTVLQNLSVLEDFTLDDARLLMSGAEFTEAQVDEAVAGLIAKSLIEPEVSTAMVRYRLSQLTRLYVKHKAREQWLKAEMAHPLKGGSVSPLTPTSSANSPPGLR